MEKKYQRIQNKSENNSKKGKKEANKIIEIKNKYKR